VLRHPSYPAVPGQGSQTGRVVPVPAAAVRVRQAAERTAGDGRRVGAWARPLRPVAHTDEVATLGEFLLARREALKPDDVGLRPDARPRRVVGLRREEVASIAGVSPAYYTRLERGLSRHASDQVLSALAEAFRLSGDEREHMQRLARPPRRRPCAHSPVERVRPATQAVLDACAGAPALVLGRSLDILAWNRLGHALFAPHLPTAAATDANAAPNLARLLFDSRGDGLWEDWDDKARGTVSYLRFASSRYPDDAVLGLLVAELASGSRWFADLWRVHEVQDCRSTMRRLRHPDVGPLVLTEEVMRLADPGHVLAVYLAEPGSPSAAALSLLAGGATTRAELVAGTE